uniref:MYND-type domain-containing protein n=1 Tax=Setaria digitata TaxID=48799 RepID=A0A915PFZ4_9BILA
MTANTTFSRCPVYLGFGNAIEPHLSYRLLSHYMPLGKIGGKPAWLNPVNLPPNNFLLCRVCEKPMVFLTQVYATSPDDQNYSFHRTLFFFICRNSQCSRSNDASNVRAFRCTLSRFNDFYASEEPIDPDLEGDIPDPFWKQTYPHLCQICGCNATKKCGRCESTWYCSREHQTIDWSSSHKRECCKQSSTNQHLSAINMENIDDCSWVKRKRSFATNAFVFPEYAIEMAIEQLPRSSRVDSDDDDDDGNDENNDSDDGSVEKRMEEYRQYIKKHKNQCDSGNGDLEDLEDFADKDSAFKYFNKVVAMNPEQVLRYSRGGEPLLATDHAPPPGAIPPCSLCGSERQFELQLMPHLLALIGVDDLGADNSGSGQLGLLGEEIAGEARILLWSDVGNVVKLEITLTVSSFYKQLSCTVVWLHDDKARQERRDGRRTSSGQLPLCSCPLNLLVAADSPKAGPFIHKQKLIHTNDSQITVNFWKEEATLGCFAAGREGRFRQSLCMPFMQSFDIESLIGTRRESSAFSGISGKTPKIENAGENAEAVDIKQLPRMGALSGPNLIKSEFLCDSAAPRLHPEAATLSTTETANSESKCLETAFHAFPCVSDSKSQCAPPSPSASGYFLFKLLTN